ncbi:hypothetical protein HHK36_024088 [Tetracentron sinense]|uniref:Uncharacterized protein n=1 Tax=Tetracentron sinense TaxID=13715 RepID=A0A834YP40_TETSI|nr:hypothetical protein HHK36_024088 [Tetracentron sinense]
MSGFFGFLKRILGVEENQANRDAEPLDRNTSSRNYFHHETSIRSPSPSVFREESNTRIGIQRNQNSAPVNSNLQPQVSQWPIRLPAPTPVLTSSAPPPIQHRNVLAPSASVNSNFQPQVSQLPIRLPAPTPFLTSSAPPPIRHRNVLAPVQTPCSSDSPDGHKKTEYVWVQKDTDPVYAIPEDFKDLIKNDIIPQVLKRPLSPLTYRDYFAALLYAEDFYVEVAGYR